MAVSVTTQAPACDVCTTWLLPRGARELSPESAPVTIPNSWCVSPEMQVSGASLLATVGSKLPPTVLATLRYSKFSFSSRK
jgi:hypothetical protein